MYYPFVRGKRHELLALRRTSEIAAENRNTVPVIEPVRNDTSDLVRAADAMEDAGIRYILIMNPLVGEVVNNKEQFEQVVSEEFSGYRNICYGYVVSQASTIGQVGNFIDKFAEEDVAFIHYYSFHETGALNELINSHGQVMSNIFMQVYTSTRYQRAFTGMPKVLIDDPFHNRRNVDHPPEEYFSDLHLTYADDGFDGFGDFLIVGEEFREGGPPHAIAIHLTYEHESGDIWVKHFISDRTEGPVDPAGKFLEALRKLVQTLHSNNGNSSFSTAGCSQFESWYEDQHYPGLGSIKEASMQHHIELMSGLAE